MAQQRAFSWNSEAAAQVSLDTIFNARILTSMSVTSKSAEFNTDIVPERGGGFGLMADFSSARSGARVMVLEKTACIGGTTALSVGTICAAGTRLQRKAGIDDCAVPHFADMDQLMGLLVSRGVPRLRRILVDTAPRVIETLEELGVTFMGTLPEPPHSLMRLHAVLPHSRSFIRHLETACRKAGVVFVTNARVTGLTQDDGAVRGVALKNAARHGTAERGVTLTTGDFSSASADYKRTHMYEVLLKLSAVKEASIGDGQRMAEAIGAEVLNGDLAWGAEVRFFAPPRPSIVSRKPTNRFLERTLRMAMDTLPQALLRPILLRFVTTFLAPSLRLFEEGAILVNREGERFCDELDRPQDAIADQPDQVAWIVIADRCAQRFCKMAVLCVDGTGRRLCLSSRLCAVTAGHLLFRTGPRQRRRQGGITHGSGRTERRRLKLGRRLGPFHILGPARSWIVFSEGGLRIDKEFRVLDTARKPIPGLFAAGSAGQGGVILEGHGHHLAWAFVSGLLAGRTAALSAARP